MGWNYELRRGSQGSWPLDLISRSTQCNPPIRDKLCKQESKQEIERKQLQVSGSWQELKSSLRKQEAAEGSIGLAQGSMGGAGRLGFRVRRPQDTCSSHVAVQSSRLIP